MEKVYENVVNGDTFCIHDKYKAYYRECEGSAFCEHGKQCCGSFICEHEKERGKCHICDEIGYLKSVVSCHVRSDLLGNKTQKPLEYLGCDIIIFKAHLELKIVDGMS